MEAASREHFAIVRAWLEHHRDEIRAVDLDFAAFVCVTTVESLTHAAVLHRPQSLRGAGERQFVDETTRLLAGYLR